MYISPDVRRRFNLTHVTKMIAQTFPRGPGRRIQLGKVLYIFRIFFRIQKIVYNTDYEHDVNNIVYSDTEISKTSKI